MPGLLHPIRQYEILSEAQHGIYWQGTSDEYLQLLEVAQRAAKAAHPGTQIILSGMTFGDLMDDRPSSATLAQRIRGHKLEKQYDFNEAVLKRPDLFDIVEFHYLTDYKGIYGIVDWLRGEMRRNGYEKPIWAGDAFSGPLIYPDVGTNPLFSNKRERRRLADQMREGDGQSRNEVQRWFRREQASLMTKKFILAMEVGLAGVMMGNTGDWVQFLKWRFKGTFAESSVFQGLIDYKGDPKKLLPGQPRPAYYTLSLLIDKLKDVTSVQRLDTDPKVYAFRIKRTRDPLYVMWYDDNVTSMPGEKTPRISVTLNVKNTEVKITHIITEYGHQEPKIEKHPVKNGALALYLEEIPIFIEGTETLSVSR